jgi:hypothetical protein
MERFPSGFAASARREANATPSWGDQVSKYQSSFDVSSIDHLTA